MKKYETTTDNRSQLTHKDTSAARFAKLEEMVPFNLYPDRSLLTNTMHFTFKKEPSHEEHQSIIHLTQCCHCGLAVDSLNLNKRKSTTYTAVTSCRCVCAFLVQLTQLCGTGRQGSPVHSARFMSALIASIASAGAHPHQQQNILSNKATRNPQGFKKPQASRV